MYNFNIDRILEMLNLSTTQHSTRQRNMYCATDHNTTLRNATQQIQHNSDTTDRNTTQRNATQQNRHNTTDRNTTQRNTTQCNTTQQNSPQHNKLTGNKNHAHMQPKQTSGGNVELDQKLHRKKRSKSAASSKFNKRQTLEVLTAALASQRLLF